MKQPCEFAAQGELGEGNRSPYTTFKNSSQAWLVLFRKIIHYLVMICWKAHHFVCVCG